MSQCLLFRDGFMSLLEPLTAATIPVEVLAWTQRSHISCTSSYAQSCRLDISFTHIPSLQMSLLVMFLTVLLPISVSFSSLALMFSSLFPLNQMTRQQEIGNALFDRILVSTMPANQLSICNTRFH